MRDMDDMQDLQGNRWVFGYGSLMWSPDFSHIRAVPARMHGVHRALCVYSYVHRGTPERPGLVLGLDEGGACDGVAFEIAQHDWREVVDYLRAREQVTGVYVECERAITLHHEHEAGSDTPSKPIQALVYLADQAHPQYAGQLSLADQLIHVCQGHGKGGPNIDYILSTVRHLRQMGIKDDNLMQLATRLEEVKGTP